MATGAHGVVALVSVHPEFANLILTGRKTVEFRKRRFAEAITHVVIYATSPVQKVLGFFEVSGVYEDTPGRLWNRYRKEGGIGRKVFLAYYGESPRGIAIEVGRVFTLSRPLSLSQIGRSGAAPQSFRYISGDPLTKLVRKGYARVEPGNRSLVSGV